MLRALLLLMSPSSYVPPPNPGRRRVGIVVDQGSDQIQEYQHMGRRVIFNGAAQNMVSAISVEVPKEVQALMVAGGRHKVEHSFQCHDPQASSLSGGPIEVQC